MAKFESIRALIDHYEARFIPENAAGVDAVVQLNLSGDETARYIIIIKDRTLHVEEGEHDDPLLTITSSASDWLKLNNGEANPMTMMMTGKLKVKGPIQMAAQFRSMFE
jgi:putative sterol carrier protein